MVKSSSTDSENSKTVKLQALSLDLGPRGADVEVAPESVQPLLSSTQGAAKDHLASDLQDIMSPSSRYFEGELSPPGQHPQHPNLFFAVQSPFGFAPTTAPSTTAFGDFTGDEQQASFAMMASTDTAFGSAWSQQPMPVAQVDPSLPVDLSGTHRRQSTESALSSASVSTVGVQFPGRTEKEREGVPAAVFVDLSILRPKQKGSATPPMPAKRISEPRTNVIVGGNDGRRRAQKRNQNP